MDFKKIPPPDHLKDFVRYFWTMEGHAQPQGPQVFRTIADGSPGMIFRQPSASWFYQKEKELPVVFLFGQATTHAEIVSTGTLCATGVFFRPNALKTVFGLNADELTDSCVDANLLSAKDGFNFADQLQEAVSPDKQINLMANWLVKLAGRHYAKEDEAVRYALLQIAGAHGNINLRSLQESLPLSVRSFERKFKASVGIPPRLFARICRFQASLQQMRQQDYSKLSDLAFDHDYADQSHFIRAFKEFAGFSPWQLQKQSYEAIENLTVLPA